MDDQTGMLFAKILSRLALLQEARKLTLAQRKRTLDELRKFIMLLPVEAAEEIAGK